MALCQPGHPGLHAASRVELAQECACVPVTTQSLKTVGYLVQKALLKLENVAYSPVQVWLTDLRYYVTMTWP